MSAVGLEGIDQAAQQAHIWINDLDRKLGWDNKPRSYRLLKAALHVIRDHLQLNEAVHLGAQLPTLIPGRVLRAVAASRDAHQRPAPGGFPWDG